MSDSPSEVQSWRAPAVVGVKAVLSAAIGIVVVAVFFPHPIGIPVAVLLAAWGLGMGVRRPAVTLDPGRGRLAVTMGLLTRRVALADISVIQVEGTKVTFGKTDGTAVSVRAWRHGRLDRWLRVPDIAGDMAHAISKAASAVRPQEKRPDEAGARAVTKSRSGRNMPLLVMTVAGLIEIAAVFFVRVSWPGPVMTALGAVVALAFGVTGMFTIVFSLWTYLGSRRPGRTGAARARG